MMTSKQTKIVATVSDKRCEIDSCARFTKTV